MSVKYTHHARFYGVPCLFNIDTGDMGGYGKLGEFLLEYWSSPIAEAMNFFYQLFGFEPAFGVKLLEELKS